MPWKLHAVGIFETNNELLMKYTILAVTVALAACARTQVQQVPVQQAPPLEPAPDLSTAAASIRPVDFYSRIGFLASDALGGRDTPSPGLEAAAAYIASEFHSFGLKPAGDPGSFIQRWPFSTRAADIAGMRATLRVRQTEIPLTVGADFYARPGVRGSFSGGLVFTGTALPATGREVLRGNAVIIAPANVPTNQMLTPLRAVADSAGAGAVLIVLPLAYTADSIATRVATTGRAGTIPVFFVRQDRMRELFRAARVDFDALTRTGAAARPVVLAGGTAALNATDVETVHRVPNVAGMLEGSDPQLKNTYVVFSAHIDHVGSNCRGVTPQDNICNGADDDASGTSAIVELAEAFAQLPVKPKRSLIFLGVSGEEKGLRGSAHFADNPTVPIESIVANVNIDMIGRNNPDSIVVIGQKYSTLGPLLHRVNLQHPELRMTVSEDLWPQERFFFRSDHYNFARREVPAIFFFTGTHEDYHGAGDHVEKINLDKITRVTRLVFYYANEIANDTNKPQWDPAGLEEVRRLVRTGR